MLNKAPWFTIATMAWTASMAVMTVQDALPPKVGIYAGTAALVLGGIGKAVFQIGKAMEVRGSLTAEEVAEIVAQLSEQGVGQADEDEELVDDEPELA